MNIYLSGGCKNGKSEIAENIAKKLAKDNKKPLYYVATMIPKDKEDLKRVQEHKKSRGNKGFETLELKSIENFMEMLDGCVLDSKSTKVNMSGVFLVDSITALLENTMFDKDYNVYENAWRDITDSLSEFMKVAGHVVFVSDFLFSDGVLYDAVTEIYRKNLAMCDRILAAECDRVYEVAFGFMLEYKNK